MDKPHFRCARWLLLPGLIMSVGWGLRGFIGGGPLGAMIPGALVALAICQLLGLTGARVASIAAFAAVGVGFGGQETYGQTMQFLSRHEVLSLAFFGLAVKGLAWGLVGGASLGAGMIVRPENRRVLLMALAFMVAGTTLGWKFINDPKLLYFSNPLDRPREELWAGLLGGGLFFLGALRVAGLSNLPGRFAMAGALGGGVGFPLGGLLMLTGRLLPLAKDSYPGWKVMEFTFGLCFGLALGACAWLNRERLAVTSADLARNDGSKPVLSFGLAVVAGMVVWAGLQLPLRFNFTLAGAVLLAGCLFSVRLGWQLALSVTIAAFTRDVTGFLGTQHPSLATFSVVLLVVISAGTAGWVAVRTEGRGLSANAALLFLLWIAVSAAWGRTLLYERLTIAQVVVTLMFTLLALATSLLSRPASASRLTSQPNYSLHGGVLILLLLSVTSGVSTVEAVPVSRPNVLFIAADDLRTDLGCYGDAVAKTPNIDRLATRGMLFQRAYAQQTICNPSRASVMTGLRPDTLHLWNLGTHFRTLVPNVVTLPQLFKQAGYFTRSIGKVYHNFTRPNDDDPPSWSVPAVLHWGSHGRDVAVLPAGAPVPPNLSNVHSTEIRDVPDEAYLDGRVAATAVAALGDLKAQGRPFFLAVGFWKPHRPFNAPKRYWDLYRPEDIPDPFPEKPGAEVPALAVQSQLPDLVAEAGKSPEKQRELRRGYYAATSYLDAQVGKVVAELDRLGLAHNTIIVFWSDHGFLLGEHGVWGKTTCFELDARVPLIVVPAGGISGGQRTHSIVELVDIYPTLAGLAGLTAPATLEGRSLLPVLRNSAATVKDVAFTEHPRPWVMIPPVTGDQADAMGYSVRTDRYRYTEWRDWKSGRALAIELYDHRSDPAETKTLASDPTLASVRDRLRQRLEQQFPRPR